MTRLNQTRITRRITAGKKIAMKAAFKFVVAAGVLLAAQAAGDF